MRDYNGKKVYLGIDVHKKTYAVTAICDGQVVKKDTLAADPSILVGYCKKYFPNAEIESAYEAGFSGFHLHRVLISHDIKNNVVHAAGIEVASGDRVKTDKRDSLKIATQLSVGRLKGIYVPSITRENYRSLTRLRDSFVRQRTRVGCQIKSLLFQHGLIRYDHGQKTSLKWIQSLQEKQMSPELKYAVEQYAMTWTYMDSKIKEAQEQIALQAKKDEALEKTYQSAPGIGPTAARILANELGDMSQFATERQLFSYTGLTPSEHSSGDRIRQGHISRQGKPIFRRILVQAAWMAIRHDPSLELIYTRVSIKAGGKRAIVGVARRLIGRLRACFKTGNLYCIQNGPDANGEIKAAKS